MEHLSLEIFDIEGKDSKYARLQEGASITITATSEIFASGDVWSHSFTLNVFANAHIFGTSGDMHGSRLHEQLHNRRARLWVDGLPMYLGYLKLDDEVDVDEDGNVDVTFESGKKTFDELIEGGKANQVPMMSDVQIGLALWRKRWTAVSVQLTATAVFKNGNTSNTIDLTHETFGGHGSIGDTDEQLTYFESDGEDDGTSVQQYPRMVFPKGTFYNMETGKEDDPVNFINTDYPYDDSHPYCNIALCYQKSGYTVTKEEGGIKTTYDDYSSEPTEQRGYEVMPANRVNSAPNFFVIYWVKALMKHLNIHIEENQMMDVEDLKRLFFVNTNCAYEEPDYLRSDKYDGTFGKYQFSSSGSLIAEYFGDLEKETYANTTKRWNGIKKIASPSESSFECDTFTEGKWSETVKNGSTTSEEDVTDTIASKYGAIDKIVIKNKSIAGMSERVRRYYDNYGGSDSTRNLQKNLLLHRAIASSECFPNVDISEVISALENGFGIRFLFDDNYQRVRILLLRNIFRNEEIQDVACDIISESKTENCIRGFKLTYGDSDDTQFKYKGFDDLLPHKKELWIDKSDKHDYSHWNLSADYGDLIHKISAFDKTCYVTPNTGNAYIIKVDEDAKRYDQLYPSLFEDAGYMDAEDGDCTGEDNTIKTITMGFKPAIMNDANYGNERDDPSIKEQRFALFVDETMRPRRPDLGDLPNNDQPGVKSYDDSDAVYSTDELYKQHGPKVEDKTKMMVSDGVVMPGSFCVASDMYVEQDFSNLKLTASWVTTNPNAGSYYQYTHTAQTTLTNLKIKGHINEGYRLYLQDNFEPNDDGICPVETHDWGLTLGIMRGSGSDAYVSYTGDPDDGEGNDTWDKVPGSNVSAHTDTCDSYGNLWDYNGSSSLYCTTSAEAIAAMQKLWPNSNINLTDRTSTTFILGFQITTVKNSVGDYTSLLFASYLADGTRPWQDSTTSGIRRYAKTFANMTVAEMYQHDKDTHNILIEVGSSCERMHTLLALQQLAFNDGSEVIIDGGDNGVGVTEGRFSLKLRAEKLNPYYNKTNAPSGADTTKQYLEITNPNLRGRGLIDQFYKEYSYWVRNARIANLEVRMELAQFLAIDKTKRVTIGDFTGFIKKMEFTVSNKSGLGNVKIELMYI